MPKKCHFLKKQANIEMNYSHDFVTKAQCLYLLKSTQNLLCDQSISSCTQVIKGVFIIYGWDGGGGWWFGKIDRRKKKAPPPREYAGKKITPTHDTVGKFCPPPPTLHVLKNMPLLCCYCAPTNSYNTCNVTFAKKSSQNNALKKSPLQKSMLKKVGPPHDNRS